MTTEEMIMVDKVFYLSPAASAFIYWCCVFVDKDSSGT